MNVRNVVVIGMLCVAAICCIPLLAAEWEPASPEKDEEFNEADCGDVTGKVGASSSFTHSQLTRGMWSEGCVGAQWGYQDPEPDAGTRDLVTKENYLKHLLTRDEDPDLEYDGLRVRLDSTVNVSGYARRYVAGSEWKWNTSATVTESVPQVRGFDPTLNKWIGVGLTFDEDPENPGKHFDTPGFGSASDPAGNNREGGLLDGTSSFDPGGSNRHGKIRATGWTNPAWTILEAKVTWNSTGGSSEALNCQVSTEKLRLDFTFETRAIE